MAKQKITRREADLYPLLKSWLEAGGYLVNAEVGDCDVIARKDGEMVAIEMKLALNLDLILQVLRRQEVADSVYAAVLAPTNARERRWKETTALLRRLEAGLLVLHLDSALPRVEVAFHPIGCERRKNHQGNRALLREISGRTLDLNIGGSARTTRMTSYRENALLVAVALERTGPASPALLRSLGTGDKTCPILYDNHYGWFERLGKGLYSLTNSGRSGLDTHHVLVEKLRERLAIDACAPA